MNPILFFLKDLRKTGALAPSSRFLAEDITELFREQIQQSNTPLRILELGPGSGSLTKQIVSSLRPIDSLDLVEINPHFTRLLRRRYNQDNIKVHYTDFLEFYPQKPYDYIFSSIPYETIPESVTELIWQKKLDLSKAGGKIMYYKYLNFNHFRCKFEKELVKECCVDKKLVFLNLPPAKLFTLQVNNEALDVKSAVKSRISA